MVKVSRKSKKYSRKRNKYSRKRNKYSRKSKLYQNGGSRLRRGIGKKISNTDEYTPKFYAMVYGVDALSTRKHKKQEFKLRFSSKYQNSDEETDRVKTFALKDLFRNNNYYINNINIKNNVSNETLFEFMFHDGTGITLVFTISRKDAEVVEILLAFLERYNFPYTDNRANKIPVVRAKPIDESSIPVVQGTIFSHDSA